MSYPPTAGWIAPNRLNGQVRRPTLPRVPGEGSVAQLWRHPVKSLQGEQLEAVTVDA